MGLREMVVVHANGATLSCRLEDSERVRQVSEAGDDVRILDRQGTGDEARVQIAGDKPS